MLTNKELIVMNWIAFNDYTPLNGGTPESADEAQCWFWTDEIAAEIDSNEHGAAAVVGSLVTKGLVWTAEGGPGDDAAIGFTEKGFETWKSQ